jgi:hypothetical protein
VLLYRVPSRRAVPDQELVYAPTLRKQTLLTYRVTFEV